MYIDTVIASYSETILSLLGTRDCFVAPLLAMIFFYVHILTKRCTSAARRKTYKKRSFYKVIL
uniref:Uncharacterized protein n=1 Tax=Kuenenia stuttgartiensis TaxID=174633 RepID=Q1Q1Z1_KUEST|nr:unknown protein [Candidatus Kuenenia stuttgartiensis]